MVLVYQRTAALDHARLQGAWTVTAHEIEGDRSGEHGYKGGKIIFAGDKMAAQKPGDGRQDATFKLDANISPNALDLTPLEEKSDAAALTGIYRLEGDTLTLCLNNVPGRKRPADFASTPGHRQVLVLQRAKE
jgi:uncharacterized protein (TIGR03067 family)